MSSERVRLRGDAWEPSSRWLPLGLSELADHIVETHHGYLREAFPRVKTLLEQAIAEQPARAGHLLTLRDWLDAFWAETEAHLREEEQRMFPLARRLEVALARGEPSEEPVGPRIGALDHDHHQEEFSMDVLEGITDQFRVPEDAGETYRALMEELSAMREDWRRHTVKETELFSRAIAVEKELGREATSE